jgi:hypothetical protein
MGVLDGIVNPVVITPEETVYKDAVDAYKNTILEFRANFITRGQVGRNIQQQRPEVFDTSYFESFINRIQSIERILLNPRNSQFFKKYYKDIVKGDPDIDWGAIDQGFDAVYKERGGSYETLRKLYYEVFIPYGELYGNYKNGEIGAVIDMFSRFIDQHYNNLERAISFARRNPFQAYDGVGRPIQNSGNYTPVNDLNALINAFQNNDNRTVADILFRYQNNSGNSVTPYIGY